MSETGTTNMFAHLASPMLFMFISQQTLVTLVKVCFGEKVKYAIPVVSKALIIWPLAASLPGAQYQNIDSPSAKFGA